MPLGQAVDITLLLDVAPCGNTATGITPATSSNKIIIC